MAKLCSSSANDSFPTVAYLRTASEKPNVAAIWKMISEADRIETRSFILAGQEAILNYRSNISFQTSPLSISLIAPDDVIFAREWDTCMRCNNIESVPIECVTEASSYRHQTIARGYSERLCDVRADFVVCLSLSRWRDGVVSHGTLLSGRSFSTPITSMAHRPSPARLKRTAPTQVIVSETPLLGMAMDI